MQRVRADRVERRTVAGRRRGARCSASPSLPSILPDLFTGLRVALGFAWTTIVAAETVNGLPGLGGMAWATRSQNRADIAMMCVIVIGIIAVGDGPGLIKVVERVAVPVARQGLSAVAKPRIP